MGKMKPDAILDYAVFQLTPTRTRCELMVCAKGVTEKLTSGLLQPFLTHLRVAEEQTAAGGYSIRLEPPSEINASWFTKGTMQKFVRFVSTPEVLERVTTIDAELLQIEEALYNQANEDSGGKATQKSTPDKDGVMKKLIRRESLDDVDQDGGESSKLRLTKAMEARRSMLQREQRMAFARSIAAGFNMDNIPDIVTFSEHFGASRLRDACIKFMNFCKKRDEATQWLEEIELAVAEGRDIEMIGADGATAFMDEMDSKKLQVNVGPSAADSNMDTTSAAGQGQNSVPMQNYMHPGPWMPGFVGPYSGMMQPMIPPNQYTNGSYGFARPIYEFNGTMPWGGPMENYAGLNPPPYMGPEGQHWHYSEHNNPHSHHVTTKGRQPSSDENSQSVASDEESTEISAKKKKHAKSRRSSSPLKKLHVGRSGMRRSGMVLIKNINYITPQDAKDRNGDGKDEDENQSENETSDEDTSSKRHPKTQQERMTEKKSKKKQSRLSSESESSSLSEKDVDRQWHRPSSNQAGKESGHYHEPISNMEELSSSTANYRNADNEVYDYDYKMPSEAKMSSRKEHGMNFDSESRGRNTRRTILSSDELMLSNENSTTVHGTSKLEFGTELDGGIRLPGQKFQDSMVLPDRDSDVNGNSPSSEFFSNASRRTGRLQTGDSYIIPERLGGIGVGNGQQQIIDGDLQQTKTSSNEGIDNAGLDDSFIMPHRMIQEQMELTWKTPLSTGELEVRDEEQRPDLFPSDELLLMPERSSKDFVERSWDDSADYDFQLLGSGTAGVKNNSPADEKGRLYEQYCEKRDEKLLSEAGPKRAEREAKLKSLQDSLEKRKAELSSKVGGSKRPGYLSDTQSRAARTSLLKGKKEKEEEERKRLEKLAAERQKRIAARNAQGGSAARNAQGGSTASTPRSVKQTPSTFKSLSTTKSLSRKPDSVSASSSMATRESSLRGTPKITNRAALSRSVPSVSELRKENAKPSVEQVKKRTNLNTLDKSKSSTASTRKSEGLLDGNKSTGTHPSGAAMNRIETKKRALTTRKSIASLRELKGNSEAPTPVKAGKGPTPIEKSLGKLVDQKTVEKGKITTGDKPKDALQADNNLIENPKTVIAKNETEVFDVHYEKPGNSIDTCYPDIGMPTHTDIPLANKQQGCVEIEHLLSTEVPIKSLKGLIVDDHVAEVKQIFHKNDTHLSNSSSSVLLDSTSQVLAPEPRHVASLPMNTGDNGAVLNQYPEHGADVCSTKIAVSQRASLTNGHQAGKDHTKGGFKRLLKFGRKSKNSETLLEGDVDEGVISDADSGAGHSGRMKSGDDESAEVNNHDGHSLSSIPVPPADFKLREDHLSGGTMIKAPRSFFSLPNFRNKVNEPKIRA